VRDGGRRVEAGARKAVDWRAPVARSAGADKLAAAKANSGIAG
jgi:hypothetical protein